MFYLDAHAGEVRGSGWIKIGVDTGAGKTAWPQGVTYGKKLPGHVDLTFRTATGELVKSGERLYVEGCDVSEFEVFKHRCANHCCLLESTRRWVASLSCMLTKVTFPQGFECREENRCVDPEGDERLTRLDYCSTVAYKENNVYNIYMKPRGNKTDAMPLSEDSDKRSSGGCRPGPNP